jgi:hypothetical protein
VKEIKKEILFPALVSFPLILIIISFVLSCGYHFRAAGESIGVDFNSLAIPIFSSTSSFMGVEGEFTRIVREEFLNNSNMRIDDKDKVQAVLSGRIYSITTEPLTYAITQKTINNYLSTDEVTSSRKLEIRVDVALTDRVTGKIIWQDPNLTGEATFAVSTDPLVEQYNQRQALISIAHDLATKIYSRTMERF